MKYIFVMYLDRQQVVVNLSFHCQAEMVTQAHSVTKRIINHIPSCLMIYSEMTAALETGH